MIIVVVLKFSCSTDLFDLGAIIVQGYVIGVVMAKEWVYMGMFREGY